MLGIRVKLVRDNKGVMHLTDLKSLNEIEFDVGLINNGKIRINRYDFNDRNVSLNIDNLDFEMQSDFDYLTIFRGLLEKGKVLVLSDSSPDKMGNVIVERIRRRISGINGESGVENGLSENGLWLNGIKYYSSGGIINDLSSLLNIMCIKEVRRFGSITDNTDKLSNTIILNNRSGGYMEGGDLSGLDKIYSKFFEICSTSVFDRDFTGYNKKTEDLIKEWEKFSEHLPLYRG
jgi:hypothetical protein